MGRGLLEPLAWMPPHGGIPPSHQPFLTPSSVRLLVPTLNLDQGIPGKGERRAQVSS